MSHIVTIKVEVRNKAAAERAADHVGATKMGGEGSRLFIKPRGWYGFIDFDLEKGEMKLDHDVHACHKNDVDQFLQRYAAEVVIQQATQQGYFVQEQQLEDGSLQLNVVEY